MRWDVTRVRRKDVKSGQARSLRGCVMLRRCGSHVKIFLPLRAQCSDQVSLTNAEVPNELLGLCATSIGRTDFLDGRELAASHVNDVV